MKSSVSSSGTATAHAAVIPAALMEPPSTWSRTHVKEWIAWLGLLHDVGVEREFEQFSKKTQLTGRRFLDIDVGKSAGLAKVFSEKKLKKLADALGALQRAGDGCGGEGVGELDACGEIWMKGRRRVVVAGKEGEFVVGCVLVGGAV